MIRKLPSGKYRLYSRKKNPKTGRRRNLGTFAATPRRSSMSVRCNISNGTRRSLNNPAAIRSPFRRAAALGS